MNMRDPGNEVGYLKRQFICDLLSSEKDEVKLGMPRLVLLSCVLGEQGRAYFVLLYTRLFYSVNLFTSDDAKSKIVKLSKITNWGKLKTTQHHSKVLLNSFPMNGHTLEFCP